MNAVELYDEVKRVEREVHQSGTSEALNAVILLGIWRTQICILDRLEKMDKVLGDGITLKARNIYGPN